MNKIIAVAALAAALLTVPTVPALAQSAYPAHCLFCRWQADCRAAISDALSMDAEPAPVVVRSRHDHGGRRGRHRDLHRLADPRWWTCTPAAEGAKYLLECD